MPLFQATNITPSSFGGGANGVVDANNIIYPRWQLNGNSPLYAYQYRIMENTVEGKQVYSTDKISLDVPLEPINFRNEQQFFEFELLPEDNGMVNGFQEGYKSEITQWWSNNESYKIVQSSPSFFITRTTPILEIDYFPLLLDSRIHEFTAIYSQAENTRLNWFRWQLVNDIEHLNIIADSGKVHNSSDIRFIYDGFFAGTDYAIKLTAETQDGISIETEWIDFSVSYLFEKILNVLKACPASDGASAIETNWSELVVIIGKPLNDNYSYLNDIPVFQHNSILLGDDNRILYDEVTGNPMNFPTMLNYIWSGAFESKDYKPSQIFGNDDLGNKIEMSLQYRESLLNGIICELFVRKKELMSNIPIIFGNPLNDNYRFISDLPIADRTSIQIDKNNSVKFNKVGEEYMRFPIGLTYAWNGRIEGNGTIFEIDAIDQSKITHKIRLDYNETVEIIHEGLFPDGDRINETLFPDNDRANGVLFPDCNIYKWTSYVTIYLDDNILFDNVYEHINTIKTSQFMNNFSSIVITPTQITISLFHNDRDTEIVTQNYADISDIFGHTTQYILLGKQSCNYLWIVQDGLEPEIFDLIINDLSYEPKLEYDDNTLLMCLFKGIVNVSVGTISLTTNNKSIFDLKVLQANIDEVPDEIIADGWWTIAITPNKIHLNWFDWTELDKENYKLRASVIGSFDIFYLDNIQGGNAQIPVIMRFFDGGNASTISFARTLEGGGAYTIDPFRTTSIIINGQQKCDYIWITKNQLTDNELADLTTLEFEPEWNLNTKMLAKFNGSLSAGNAFNEFDILIGVFVYRFDFLDGTFNRIGQRSLKELSLLDYTALSQQQYQYYLFPIGNKTFGQPVLSNLVTPIFWNWSLLDCKRDDEYTYEVIREYRFGLNLTSGDLNNNTGTNILKNFTPYPKYQTDSSNYVSGSLSGLIGYIENGLEYRETPDMAHKLWELTTNGNPKFLKNRNGFMWKVDISQGIGMSIADSSGHQQMTATINWFECGSIEDIKVIGGSEYEIVS